MCKAYNKSITALLWFGQYGGIFSPRLLYCPSLRSGQYCQPRTEYSPVLPSQSCSNIILSNIPCGTLAVRMCRITFVYMYSATSLKSKFLNFWDSQGRRSWGGWGGGGGGGAPAPPIFRLGGQSPPPNI